MRSFACRTVLTLCCVLVADGVPALIIDDFEAGDFNVTDTAAPGGTTGQQSGLPTANVVGGVRLVTLAAGGGTGNAVLVTTVADDSAVLDVTTTTGTSSFHFGYDGIADGIHNGSSGTLNLDLSSFGAVLVSMLGASVGATLRMSLWTSTISGLGNPVPVTLGDNLLPLADFVGLDLTDIQSLRISLTGLGPVDLQLMGKIEAVPEPGTALLIAMGLAALAARRRHSIA